MSKISITFAAVIGLLRLLSLHADRLDGRVLPDSQAGGLGGSHHKMQDIINGVY